MSTTPFNESFVSPHIAPERGEDGVTDFDYDAVERGLGEPEQSQSRELADAAAAFGQVIKFIIEHKSDLGTQRRQSAIFKRAVAAAWVISPANFGGISLTDLAKQIGVSPASLAGYTGEFSRRFNFRCRAQAHYKPGMRDGGHLESTG